MSEHILFLTGKLAQKSLHQVLEGMAPTGFDYTVHDIGISVAGLMTTEMILRRLDNAMGATRMVLPGRCRGELAPLAAKYRIPVERGPDDLKDMPQFFGRAATRPDLSQQRVLIFGEIVEAAQVSVARIVERATYYRDCGADVIDLGFLPGERFEHLEEAITELKRMGLRVSVDSLAPEDLIRGGRAGADYLLSLHEGTLHVVDEVASTPILVGQPAQDMASLERAMEAIDKRGRAMLCDPILEPIHFGFTESIVRYRDFRAKYPDVPMMMGVGNLTELTDADTAGINALLFGIISELRVDAVLATEVSPHARSAIREADHARRIMFWSGERNRLPKDVDDSLMNLHERRPFPYTPDEIGEFAAAVKDANYRIQVSEAGVHLYNRDGLLTEGDPYDFFPKLREALGGDAGHAFYLGVELARAHMAWKLGKRYDQDEDLKWGAALPPVVEDLTHQKALGATMPLRRQNKGRTEPVSNPDTEAEGE